MDQTIGDKFDFRVFSRRWGHADKYAITRTANGWDVQHMAIGGPCDKKGEPALFANFQQDSITYPFDIGDFLEWLWDEAARKGLTHDEVQTGLTQLADWVSTCEKATPGGVFAGYK